MSGDSGGQSRKGRLYVICKSNPCFKAVQGRKKKR
ncbi:TPA: 50S ribosomal protein L36 [Escherichia coli]|nr:50S ribosomal protein L36 [Escherichia coli]HCP1509209.1 50S ribosomal protein L36 [Escherichia coli]HCP1666007.1 50S ribosomal protein L36 [Escherichia coli]HCP1807393.1 50S ribosomal protein L36 [Escherichia coli]